MTIDLSQLNAAELEALIAEAAQRRAQMPEPWSGDRPEGAPAIQNPPWYVSMTTHGALLQIAYPGLGWLSFLIPPTERSTLAGLLLQQTLAHLNDAVAAATAANAGQTGAAAPSTLSGPVGGGGGSVH